MKALIISSFLLIFILLCTQFAFSAERISPQQGKDVAEKICFKYEPF